uniref:tRNA(His) guanylyltransferase n=1 Tax=Strigamia maritima TaxID=126957 RepID=T1IQ68_STRMM
MAKEPPIINKYGYVKSNETDPTCLPGCWIVVRVDGKAFHRFSKAHNFTKPNDQRALGLMNQSAVRVMDEYRDIRIAYGESDEFSFVILKDTDMYSRRKIKIATYIAACFTARYQFHWAEFFPETKLQYPPHFDAHIAEYPNDVMLRDYLSWRQNDCHINNSYNTVFWALIQKGGMTPAQAEERLRGTLFKDKNEILFSEFGINYNNEPELFRKGTTVIRKKVSGDVKCKKTSVVCLNVDIIKNSFWTENYASLGVNFV